MIPPEIMPLLGQGLLILMHRSNGMYSLANIEGICDYFGIQIRYLSKRSITDYNMDASDEIWLMIYPSVCGRTLLPCDYKQPQHFHNLLLTFDDFNFGVQA